MRRRAAALLIIIAALMLPLMANFFNLFPAQVTEVVFTTCEMTADRESARRRLEEVIQPGDIILARGSGVEDLLVGIRYSPYWTHAMIYVGGGNSS